MPTLKSKMTRIEQLKNLQKITPLINIFINFMLNDKLNNNLSFISNMYKAIYTFDKQHKLITGRKADDNFRVIMNVNSLRTDTDAQDPRRYYSERMIEYPIIENGELNKRRMYFSIADRENNIKSLVKVNKNKNHEIMLDMDLKFSYYPSFHNINVREKIKASPIEFESFISFILNHNMSEKIEDIDKIKKEYIGNTFIIPKFKGIINPEITKREYTDFEIIDDIEFRYITNWKPVSEYFKSIRFDDMTSKKK